MKKTKSKIFRLLKLCVSVVVGNALLAFTVAAFIIPHDIIMGGTTGIGIVLNELMPIDTALLILVLNIILLVFGGIVLGFKFFLTTVASSVLYPIMLAGMQKIPAVASVTGNNLLASLVGGCIMGISIGMLMRVGSSTGGMDVVNLVLHKWFHLPVAVFVSATDIIVIGGQALFSSPEQLFLGIITLVCETLMIEQIMVFGKSQLQIFVVSDSYEEIRRKLIEEKDVGVTMAMIETGFFENKQKGILCVISPRKLYEITETIQSADPEAFITVTKIKEVRGRGFTLARYTQTYGVGLQSETDLPTAEH